jgi:hypothetical protein
MSAVRVSQGREGRDGRTGRVGREGRDGRDGSEAAVAAGTALGTGAAAGAYVPPILCPRVRRSLVGGCTFSSRLNHGREVSQGSGGREGAGGRAGNRSHSGRAFGSKSNAIKLIPLFLFSLVSLVASGLRILQDFAGICRGSLGIFFVLGVRGRTHNLLVLGSNPSGPTNQRKRNQRYRGPSLSSGFRVRAPASLTPARRLKFKS